MPIAVKADMGLAKAVTTILEEYGEDIDSAAEKAVKGVGDEAVKIIRDRSSKHVRTGQYVKGWRALYGFIGYGMRTLTIYNKTDWQLTHLLNNGFYSVRAKKRIAGDGHIDSAETAINDKFINSVEESLK